MVGGFGRDMAEMWHGLRHGSREAAMVAERDPDASLCCPRLRCIRMDTDKRGGLMASRNFFRAMLTALRFRAEQGLRLNKLRLGLRHDGYKDHETLLARYGEELHALVPSVWYVSSGIGPACNE